MAAPTSSRDPATTAAASCEAAAEQLRDIVTKAPVHAQAAGCVEAKRNSEFVDAAMYWFVLG